MNDILHGLQLAFRLHPFIRAPGCGQQSSSGKQTEVFLAFIHLHATEVHIQVCPSESIRPAEKTGIISAVVTFVPADETAGLLFRQATYSRGGMKFFQQIADMSGEHEFYCYGLKTDFMGNFFPGSAALMRLAEDISEVPGGLCWCGCKATMNARVNGAGQVIKVGEQVLIDNQQSIRYIGLCYKHWKMGKAYA